MAAQPRRITEAVDDAQRVTLAGHVNPRLQGAVDLGRVEPTLALSYVTLVLAPSAAQQADLDRLLLEQQDPSSANYHHWLTPEEYAGRFGVSSNDIETIVAWLKRHSLTVRSVARGRNAISFSGTAANIESAFSTEIHHYQVDGEQHYANATDPSTPAAFQGVITAIHGLTDFRLKPRSLHPRFTSPSGDNQLGPGDLAAIYDITPLYSAGINGSGQKLAVVGQTQIRLSDIEQYQSFFNLPANDPQVTVVPNAPAPGIVRDDLIEADLDLELSGGIAPQATIIYVYSNDVSDAVQYVIDQNLAPVMSDSYGLCEPQTGQAEATSMRRLAQQGNAQGITWFAASGDSGAADCVGGTDPSTNYKQSVDVPASIPEVTGVGGSEFNDGSGTYWSSANNFNQASALSYIPETAWNTSDQDGIPAASGGGASAFFSKPSWQTGPGVPADGARDVPDLTTAASPDHDGYLIYSGSLQVVGGTSAGPQYFGGVAALLNQYLVANGLEATPGLGNINPRFYALAQTGAFHDITTGNNTVIPCQGQRNCSSQPIGYNAGPGYDQVTGLGSVDVYNLVTSWHTSTSGRTAVTMHLTSTAGSLSFSGSATLTATVNSGGSGEPTGAVTFYLGSETLGTVNLAGAGGSASASLTFSGILLAPGSNTITADYNGSSTFATASATTTITGQTISAAAPSIGGVSNGASFTQAFAPGGILSVFGTQLAPATGGAPMVPLPVQMAGVSATINGTPAPFYYVSPDQLNIQIPYEVTPNSAAVLVVNNNGQTASYSFVPEVVAPGIFTFDGGAPVPYTTAARGQTITLFVTGAGAVTPSIATGVAPPWGTPTADLPAPATAVHVTVGDMTAPIQFAGIPWLLVGVVQINYQVPAQAPLGPQNVLVTIGGVASAPAKLNVTQ
jgi:uncharacterized protein (TIGR03437 family)